MMRRFVLPTLVGSVLFYIILRPFAQWLVFKFGASDVVYAVTIQSLVVTAAFAVSFLAARNSSLRLARAPVAAATSTVASVAVLLAALVLIQSAAPLPQAAWLYSEPASLSLMVILPAAVTAITLGVIRFGRPRAGAAI